MRLFRMFFNDTKNVKKLRSLFNRAFFIMFITAMIAGCAGCAGCAQCKSCVSEDDTGISRVPADVTDLKVLFIDGEATLFWVDSDDPFLDYIEITWEPDGTTPVRVERGVGTFRIPGLIPGVEYLFTVRAVDQWQQVARCYGRYRRRLQAAQA